MGTIFAIKKYAIHDGPNIRTTVFLKGCPLRCRWCHNPEGIARQRDVLWNRDKCIGCGQCLSGCAQGCLTAGPEGIVRREQSCTRCLACVECCPALAHEAVGREVEVEEVMSEILKDQPFFDETGGGVTFSGGEPLLQGDFLLALLRACGQAGIHRAVDTCGFADTGLLLEVARHCELFLIDLKHMDSATHRLHTGVANELILRNIETLARGGSRLAVRIPLIEGFNSDEENMRASAAFLAALPTVEGVDLLPYHGIAAAKYRKLGLPDPASQIMPIAAERVARCRHILSERGLDVNIGG